MIARNVLLKHFKVAGFIVSSSLYLNAQAVPTAERFADVQVGATFSLAKPDYGASLWKGLGLYADVDVTTHIGLEVDFHHVSSPDPVLYERTYKMGPRFILPVRQHFSFYSKAQYGRGVFNFAGQDPATNATVQVANLAFNIWSVGGGLDLKLQRQLNVRLFDYEYQRWSSFPPHGLNPNVFSFGLAYRFNGFRGR